ncbi:MAG: cytochrome c biogenesis protein [Chloroflexota bacterium]|nr:cytochrome c biogenesis protein [Chloroflexota bacterium]
MTVRMSLLGLSGGLMLAALGMTFLYAPTDAVLGISQRIFYVHVPLALVGFLAFAVVAVCSIGYLWKGSERMDNVAYAAAEIGVLFTSLMLITGMLWAKPAWGVWWSLSPQLTTSLILWFLYVAYLMLRAYAPPGETAARYAAVLGIIGFIDVPIVYMAARWWRDLHPNKVLGPLAEESALEPSMQITFLVSILAFTALFAWLLAERTELRRQETQLERMRYTYGQA